MYICVIFFNVKGLRFSLKSQKVIGTSSTVIFSFLMNQWVSMLYEIFIERRMLKSQMIIGQAFIMAGMYHFKKISPTLKSIDEDEIRGPKKPTKDKNNKQKLE